MAPKSSLMGYNADLFNLGTKFAQQPDTPDLWEQPFQDPYGGGAGGYSPQPQPQGQPQMGPGPAYPVGPNSWDQPQQMPQEPGVSPKKDLNHPFWSQVGQYLGSDDFKDSLLAGVIAGQMASDPKGALQMTLQFKQQREQRKFQAQQNEMQRQAVAENIKARNEAQKANKEQTDFAKRVAKIQAGLQAGNVPPETVQGWIAQNGPPGPDNIDKAETDFAILQSQVKAKEAAKKEDEKTLGSKLKVLGSIHAGGTIKDESLPDNLRKDPNFIASMATARTNAATLKDFDSRLKAARLKIATAQIKSQDPEYKVRLALAMRQLDDVLITRRGVEASMRAAEKPSAAIFQPPQETLDAYTTGLTDNLTSLNKELEDAVSDIGGIAAAKGEGKPAPEAPAKPGRTEQEKARRKKLGLSIEE